jgi:DNA-directed RNA polymerase beta' subunit
MDLMLKDNLTTGYIQRRLIKGLQDLMVNYNMTIRTNKNKVLQRIQLWMIVLYTGQVAMDTKMDSTNVRSI